MLVPDFTVTLTTPPAARPNSASKVLVWTLSSWTASTEGMNATVLPASTFGMPSSSTSLLELGFPPMEMLEVAPLSNGRAKERASVGCTPGAIRAIKYGFRPLSGRLMILVWSMTSPTEAVLASSSGASDLTSTVSVTTPGSSTTSTCTRS